MMKTLEQLETENSTPTDAGLLLKENADFRDEREATWRRINEWNLWEYIDEPGRMSDEYRNRRLRDNDLIVKADTERKIALEAKRKRFPTQYDIIDREMKGVPVLVLRNTKKYPSDYAKITDRLQKMEVQRGVSVYVDMPRAGTGKTIIRPQRCVPFSLWAERFVRRDIPHTKVERYDPANEDHNADIRFVGSFASGEVKE